MSNYTGLKHFQFLLLSLALTGAAHAADSTYRIKVPAGEPPAAEASSMPATRAETTPAEPASPAPAIEEKSKPAPVLRDSVPLRYVVKRGDTLWSIAGHFLKNPWQWPEIWYGNDQIKNPHRIYPGNVLRLVMIGGRMRLVMGDGPGNAAGGPMHLSPKVRQLDIDSAIPAIPIEAIRDFLNAAHILTEEEIDDAPYILDFADNHIVAGSESDVYVKGLEPKAHAGLYSVVRKGGELVDPDTNKRIGYEAIPVGSAEIKQIEEITHATLRDTVREARIGDSVIPLQNDVFDAYFYPRVSDFDVNGRIISIFDGSTQVTQYHIVAINRGFKQGLAPGHVLTVMQTGRTARDPKSWFGRSVQLPDTEAGSVMIFKVLPTFSYGLVMDSTLPIHLYDRVVKPQ